MRAMAVAMITALFLMSCKNSSIDQHQVYPLQQVTFNKVNLEDRFWSDRLTIQSETLVPYAFQQTHRAVENLEKAAKFLKGDTTDLPFPHRYISSDLYKVMEGASYLLMNNPDAELERQMDEIIEIIAGAQEEDGYLYVAHTTGVSKDHDHWGGAGMGDKPYSYVLHSHELYNMGHMYEAAIAYYQATGKDKWLGVAEKNARHINKVFFEGDPEYNNGSPVNQAPGHQEIELALVKLFQVTGDSLYLNMAHKFLDIRGKTFIPEGDGVMSATYSQQHLPVALQTKPTGHAVRAMYQYAAMADVSSHYHLEDYTTALDSVWHNLVDRKMHITGGLGAMHGIEGFGPDYTLPNKDTYNETCAAVGNVLFNYRMFLMTRDAKYADVAEVALYNNVLAGVNLEGNRFFYVNPLESDGETHFNHGHAGRAPWFGTACCPTNLARLIPQVSGMMYAYDESDIYVTLYGGNSTTIPLSDGDVNIRQVSEYPYEGTVKIIIDPVKDLDFNLKLRIPTWAQGKRFIPGDLYAYNGSAGQSDWTVRVNGKEEDFELQNGFAVIGKTWSKGDTVELILNMDVKVNEAHKQVKENTGKLAVTRGPLLYCLEGDDYDRIQNLTLPQWNEDQVKVDYYTGPELTGIPYVKVPVNVNSGSSTEQTEAELIPYFSWNNRGNLPMQVWLNKAN